MDSKKVAGVVLVSDIKNTLDQSRSSILLLQAISKLCVLLIDDDDLGP